MKYADLTPVPKVWGAEYWITNTGSNEQPGSGGYCMKVLRLERGHQGSLHYHPVKDETFFVMSGTVILEVGTPFPAGPKMMRLVLGPHQFSRILPGTPHRFSTIGGAVIIEASTHHSDDDVVRLEESK